MKLKKAAILCGCSLLLFSNMASTVSQASMLETENMSEFLDWYEMLETELERMTEHNLPEDTIADDVFEDENEGTEEGEHSETNTELSEEEGDTEQINDFPNETEDGMEGDTEASTEDNESELSTESPEKSELETDEETSNETETEADSETDDEKETETDVETETESEEVVSGTENETEAESEHDTETDDEAEIETDAETEIESEEIVSESENETETETETGMEEETSEYDDPLPGYGMNSASSYFWDASWYLPEDFRFTQVDKEYAIVKSEKDILQVYSESSETSTVVGNIPYFGLAYILEEDGEWSYIESGEVRGFVLTRYLNKGKFADHVVEVLGEHAIREGSPTVTAFDNTAFTHTKTTVYDVVATKQYGITLFSCDIKEYPKNDARPIGKASSGNLVYILEVAENGWYYVESGDVRGFIDPGLLLVGDTAEALFSFDEEDIRFVEELVQPQENESLYYSFKSVKIAGCTVGRDIAETAMRYVGKLPYVYGGTSLQYGADCSGFVQSVFASYGVILPRTAEAQGVNGLEVRSLEEAKVGDVVYYSSGPHVGIYIGNGMVVQCSGNSGNNYLNPGKGPTISFATYMPITSIRRYLIETGDTRADGGNRLDLTTYSQEQLELIWAIVAQEDNGSYEGALAVITSAMNRTESGVWGYAGGNALAQLMAPGQYCYSMDNYWKSRLNGNVPEYVKQAVNDCLKRGIRNHNYTCFRSTRGKTTGASAVQIGGNWFFGA